MREVEKKNILRLLTEAVPNLIMPSAQSIYLLFVRGVVFHRYLVEPVQSQVRRRRSGKQKERLYGLSGDFWNCLKSISCSRTRVRITIILEQRDAMHGTLYCCKRSPGCCEHDDRKSGASRMRRWTVHLCPDIRELLVHVSVECGLDTTSGTHLTSLK